MQQLINIHVATLIVLSAVLFGLGQFDFISLLISLVAAVLAYQYTARQQRFQVGRLAVNGAIFVIAMVTGWRLVQAHGVLQSVIIGQALIALQFVLLFEAKTVRSRWDLISLSLLTVFISTSFAHGPSFGFLLVAFFFFAFSTFALLFFQREQQICGASRSQLGDSAVVATVAVGTETNWWRLVAVACATLVVGPLALFLRFPDLSRRDKPLRRDDVKTKSARWPLWGQNSMLTTLGSETVATAATGREFRWRMARITGVSIVLSLMVFCAAPRFGRLELELPRLSEVPWERQADAPRRTVGYSDRVKLGELGAVTENQALVMEVRLMDYDTRGPFYPRGGVYLRGGILTHYEKGHWDLYPYAEPLELMHTTADPLVRQKITIKSREDGDLFCVWPFVIFEDEQFVRFDGRAERVHRPRGMFHRPFTYELATTAFDNQVQVDLVPCTRPIHREILLQWPERSLPTLAPLARQWIDQAGVPDDDRVELARTLALRLQSSGQFSYTLDETVRDPSLDPIEDFVTNHPQGHCEFFASTLALMLRSQGIPSRLVVGFRGTVFNADTKSYLVRQCDAHAWVEAYIPPEHLVGYKLPNNHSDWSHGAWLRLEPTPATSTDVAGVTRFAQQIRDMIQWIRSAWQDKVLGMTGSQQQAAIYRPLLDAFKRLGTRLLSPEQWEDLRTRQFWVVNKSLLGAAWLACLALGLSVILVRSRIRPFSMRWRWRRTWKNRCAGDNGSAVAAAFYAQLEHLLVGYGQVRRSSQTQREFARCAGQQIAATSGEQAVAAWTLEIVDAYYRVRFGQCDLDGRQAAAIDHLLAKIRKAIGGVNRTARQRT